MNKEKKQKIVVGLSGGVDSAVTAHLLKQAGHDVMGIFMQNWETNNDDPFCQAEQDLSDAAEVSKHLDIPFQVVNFAKQYWDRVFTQCLDQFTQGLTPNPDIGCNKEIKFDCFLQHALDLGADALATGHYVQRRSHVNGFQLLKGIDANKDQSYFLYTLTQEALHYARFPIGHLCKPQVREIAKRINLPNHDKKDSTGICYIGERRFDTFLKEYILSRPGPIQDAKGNPLGQHDGLSFYTIGQRKGLQIGGHQDHPEGAWYVYDKNIERNILCVTQGESNPLLFHNQLHCNQIHWIDGEMPTQWAGEARIRYRQQPQYCEFIRYEDGSVHVTFAQPQRAIAPGQAIVFYSNNACQGGGTITQRTRGAL